MIRRLKFRAHFNRVNMQRGKALVWTVHTSRACYQVKRIRILVPTETVFNSAGRQPRAYFTGYAHVQIQGQTAVLI